MVASSVKRITSKGNVPPGGYWRYKDPDDGWTFAHPYYDRVKDQAAAHRMKLGLVMAYDWDSRFDAILCQETPQGCHDVPEAPTEEKQSLLGLAAQFAVAAVNWGRSGFQTVSYEEFKRRYVICAGDESTPRCPFFTTFPRIGITRCAKCGCACGVKLHWATEHCPVKKW